MEPHSHFVEKVPMRELLLSVLEGEVFAHLGMGGRETPALPPHSTVLGQKDVTMGSKELLLPLYHGGPDKNQPPTALLKLTFNSLHKMVVCPQSELKDTISSRLVLKERLYKLYNHLSETYQSGHHV